MSVFDTAKKTVVGDIAHDAADSGSPVKIGGKAASAQPTAVSANDRVNAWLDLNGRQVVAANALLETLTADYTDFTGGGGVLATVAPTKPAWAHAMSLMVDNATDQSCTVQVRYYSSLGTTSSGVTAVHNVVVAAGARRYVAPHSAQNTQGTIVCPGLGVIPATSANVVIYLTAASAPGSGSVTVDVTWYPVPIPSTDMLAQTSIFAQNVTVGVTATAVPTTILTGRRSLMIYNNGTVPIYIGSSTVTTTSGLPVVVGQALSMDAGPGLLVYAISGTAGQNVRVLEVA